MNTRAAYWDLVATASPSVVASTSLEQLPLHEKINDYTEQ